MASPFFYIRRLRIRHISFKLLEPLEPIKRGEIIVGAKEQAQKAAQHAADCIRQQLTPDRAPTVALVLGTGWGKTLRLENERALPFKKIPSLDGLGRLEGHDRVVVCGDVNGRRVIALRGRAHMNEHPTSKKIPRIVRLQIQALCELGVRTFILANAVGGVDGTTKVGDVVVADGVIMLFAGVMPLFVGEFCSPDQLLTADLQDLAVSCAPYDLNVQTGVYSMIRGSAFESGPDKAILRMLGAKTVGMSLLPELHVVALYPKTRAVCLSLVTDAVDEVPEHSTNQARAAEKAELLGEYLECLVACLDT
jgi:purine nucleoside phosphorylase